MIEAILASWRLANPVGGVNIGDVRGFFLSRLNPDLVYEVHSCFLELFRHLNPVFNTEVFAVYILGQSVLNGDFVNLGA